MIFVYKYRNRTIIFLLYSYMGVTLGRTHSWDNKDGMAF